MTAKRRSYESQNLVMGGCCGATMNCNVDCRCCEPVGWAGNGTVPDISHQWVGGLLSANTDL